MGYYVHLVAEKIGKNFYVKFLSFHGQKFYMLKTSGKKNRLNLRHDLRRML
jgi:hypothetical protein